MIESSKMSWLLAILQERFGHQFRLSINEQGFYVLGLSGAWPSICFVRDSEMFGRADSGLPHTSWDADAEGWRSVLGSPLPAPGADYLPSPLVTVSPSGFNVAYDVLGLTYWMLSRCEEIGCTDLDGHGRFPAVSSHAHRHGYLNRPVVDEWMDVVGQIICRTWPGIKLKKPTFGMKVSHDVDQPSLFGFRSLYSIARGMVGDVIKRHDLKSAALAPWVRAGTKSRLHQRDPYNTFDWIMDVSERYGLRSAFYFMAGRTDPRDADYTIGHPAIRHLIRRIHERGHEIGLHPSYGTYEAPHLLIAEADLLRSVCLQEGVQQDGWGGRMHYLRWKNSVTPRAWADAGMTYDSTLGYADQIGFRSGTCFEYPAFDPIKQEALDLRLRPLVAMECTVMSQEYMGLGVTSAALEKFLELKKTCETVGGEFTLLWHNSCLCSAAERDLYQETLK